MSDSFPRQYARTHGFNLGNPRSIEVGSDGARVAFLRTPAGDDTNAALWVYDVAEDAERQVEGPTEEGHITDAERDRRERMREAQTGVVTYAADPALTVAAYVVGQQLLVADLTTGTSRTVSTGGSGVRPAARSHGLAGGLRHRRSPARHRPRRRDRSATGPRRTPRRALGARRVHRRGGDGTTAWLLVVAGRTADVGVPRGRAARADLAHRQPDRSGCRATGGSLSASGDRQRDRHAARRGGGRRSCRGGLGSRGVRVPGRCVVDAGRPAARLGAIARPAHRAGAGDRSGLGRDGTGLEGRRRDLDPHHPRGPGVAPRRTAAHGRPSRRYAPVAGRRRTRHARGTAGRFGDRRERRRGVPCHGGAHRDACVAPVGGWFPRAALGWRRGPRRGGGRRSHRPGVRDRSGAVPGSDRVTRRRSRPHLRSVR